MTDMLRAIAQQGDPSHVLQAIKVPAPAAGADFTFTVPGDRALRIVSVTAQLVTSAAVANRGAALVITAPEGVVITVEQPAVITAGLTTLLCWGSGVSGDATALVNGRLTAGIGEYELPPGYVVSTATAALDAADQWGSIIIWAEVRLTQPATTHQELLAEWFAEQVRAALAAEGK